MIVFGGVLSLINGRLVLFVCSLFFFFFQAEDGIRDGRVTGVQTCALPISKRFSSRFSGTPPKPCASMRMKQTLLSLRNGTKSLGPMWILSAGSGTSSCDWTASVLLIFLDRKSVV